VLGGRFAIQAVAGSGGMGTVYRARDLRSDQDVAVKVLHAQSSKPPGEQELARFQREAHVLASLRHPGIVSYVAEGQTPEGLPFLAMEWLHGGDLATRLQSGPLPVGESLSLLFAVADALAQAHEHGIVHRDLKPSNLFLRDGRTEQAVILDFGVAQWGSGGASATRTGMVIGTPEYMAPEQARGQRVITPAADVFALGSVLYHCLTGQSPFRGEHVIATLSSVLFEEPQQLRALCPAAPRALEQLIHRMLAKRSEERPADARAILSQLHTLREQNALNVITSPGGTDPSGVFVGSALLDSEQSLLSVIIAQLPADGAECAADSGASPEPAQQAGSGSTARRSSGSSTARW
jgi:serine/threonine protein kinase